MDSFFAEIRYAFRRLAQRPGARDDRREAVPFELQTQGLPAHVAAGRVGLEVDQPLAPLADQHADVLDVVVPIPPIVPFE